MKGIHRLISVTEALLTLHGCRGKRVYFGMLHRIMRDAFADSHDSEGSC
jgi:hypothetical protein